MFFRVCGALGMAGALFAIPADVLSWFLKADYNPVSQSISALAVGKASLLIDLALCVFALSCIATGAGMLRLDVAARGWRIAAFATITLAAEVAVVAMVNGYAGERNVGANLHTIAICLLYVSFAVAAFAAVPGLKDDHLPSVRYSRVIGWLWIILAPVYYFWFPSGWAGAFERALVLLMIVWVVVVADALRRAAVLRVGVSSSSGG